jgi:hypothetical protein
MEKEKMVFQEALDTYYKLKNDYQENVKKIKTQIIKEKGESWKEKRRKYASAHAKCINCERPVGSVFETKVVEGTRQLIARCGDKTDPCPLSILLELGVYERLDESLIGYKNDIEDFKRQIILEKNNVIFQYTTAEGAVKVFEDLKKKIEEYTSFYEQLNTMYQESVFPEDRVAALNDLEKRFYANIQGYKEMVEKFEKTKNVQFVRDAVEMYVNDIHAVWLKICENKYSFMDVEPENDVFQLMRVPFSESFASLEYNIAEDRVVHFITGVDKEFLKKKNKKKDEEDDDSMVLNEDEDDEEEEEEQDYEEDEEEEERPKLKIGETVELNDAISL